MPVNKAQYEKILRELEGKATLVAVSKTKTVEDIMELYDLGQRDFGENYVQEIVEKYEALPKDIRWHFIGHLQSNKVKYIAPFIHLIHGIDSEKLLSTVEKEAVKNTRVIDVLLQVFISKDETKFGFDKKELESLFSSPAFASFKSVKVRGLMGLATFTEDNDLIREEFRDLRNIYDEVGKKEIPHTTMEILSMGMSADYQFALEYNTNMVRIGSLLFGARN